MSAAQFRALPAMPALIRTLGVGLGLLFACAIQAGDLPSIDKDKVELGIQEYSELSNSRPVDKSVTSLDPHEDKSTTDHSKLKELQGPFASGPE